MVYDFDEGKILGELNDLDDEIEALSKSYYIMETLKLPGFESNYDKIMKPLARTLERLKDLKYRQESRLKIHRQKVKESGIKY